MTHLIFAYGTLKRGHYYHDDYLGEPGAQFISPATTSNDYSLYIAHGLPHLVREPADKGVKGEVWLVDDGMLKNIDNLESHPLVYKRDIIDVVKDSGETITVWAYLRPSHFSGKEHGWREYEFV